MGNIVYHCCCKNISFSSFSIGLRVQLWSWIFNSSSILDIILIINDQSNSIRIFISNQYVSSENCLLYIQPIEWIYQAKYSNSNHRNSKSFTNDNNGKPILEKSVNYIKRLTRIRSVNPVFSHPKMEDILHTNDRYFRAIFS